jgi:hypothetical protein
MCLPSMGCHSILNQGSSFRLLFLRYECECNRPSFLAKVFQYASAFNGNLNQWDVAKGTIMDRSKSIRIPENDLTCREFTLSWWWWLVQVRMLWETEWFEWKLSGSCHQHELHQIAFQYASAFNGDLNQWDVAQVTAMLQSKSIRIVENNLK